MPDDLVEAHSHSDHHRTEVLASTMAGCFYCLSTYPPRSITEWIDDGQTALCPRCGVDSVIGDTSGYALTPGFLGRMRGRWFGGA